MSKFPRRNYEQRPKREPEERLAPRPKTGGRPQEDGGRVVHGQPRERPPGARGEQRHGRAPEPRRAAEPENAPEPGPRPPGPRNMTVHGGRPPAAAAPTAWERQAGWYDQHQGKDGDDFYQVLILPAVLRQLQAAPGRRVLDVGCGQGVLGRALGELQVPSLGIDASPSLVEAAKRRAGRLEEYRLGDARDLGPVLAGERFAAATAVLCLQDLDPLEPVFAGVAAALESGGRLVMVLTHPCFRIPKRSGWGWDERDNLQFRRVEAYQSPLRLPIVTHPGQPADGASTSSFHRPIAAYLNALGGAGFGVVACEELCSHRRGTRGVRWQAEDRAAKEIPQFMVLTAVRR
jgi:SAM-dependent methyltransferase